MLAPCPCGAAVASNELHQRRVGARLANCHHPWQSPLPSCVNSCWWHLFPSRCPPPPPPPPHTACRRTSASGVVALPAYRDRCLLRRWHHQDASQLSGPQHTGRLSLSRAHLLLGTCGALAAITALSVPKKSPRRASHAHAEPRDAVIQGMSQKRGTHRQQRRQPEALLVGQFTVPGAT